MENNGGNNKNQVNVLNSLNLISYQFPKPREHIMLYKITLEGSGGEIMIGAMSKAQYDFWSKKDKEEIVDALNGYYEEEIPETAELGERYDFMDLFCSSAVSTTYFDLTIQEIEPEDEDAEDAYYNFDDYGVLKDGIENIEEKDLAYPKGKHNFLYTIDEESGILIEEELELEERFEIDKLKVKIITLPDNSKFIYGLEYDGVPLTEYTDNFSKIGSLTAGIFTK